MNNYLVAAIRKLKPNSEFSFQNNDYSTVKWDVLEGNAPTQAEIDAAIEQVKADEITEAEAKAQAKAAAEGKLAALGLTTDDLRALGL
jgi:mannose-6-phosphate isomerase-like protein (cupin superfamily)